MDTVNTDDRDSKGPSLDTGAYAIHPMTSTSTSPPVPIPTHPFANSKSLLVVIPDDKIDVEEEARLYDELCVVRPSLSFPDVSLNKSAFIVIGTG